MTAQEIVSEHNRRHPKSPYFSPMMLRMYRDDIETYTVIGPYSPTPIDPDDKVSRLVYGLRRPSRMLYSDGNEWITTWIDVDTFAITTNVLNTIR